MNTVGSDNQRGIATILIITILALLCVAVGMWFWQQPSTQGPSVDDRSEWYTCSANNDCMVVTGVCGSIEAINKQYETPWNDEKKLQEPYVRCALPQDQPSDFTASCEAKKCVAKRVTSEWQTYRNEEYGFEVKYPKNLMLDEWQLDENDKLGHPHYYRTSFTFLGDKRQSIAGFGISLFDNPQKFNVDDWVAAEYEGMISSPIEPILINNIRGLKFKISELGATVITVFAKENHVIVFSYDFMDPDEPIYRTLVNNILSTFRFVESNRGQVYRNEQYDFELTLSDSWRGYSVIEEQWMGETINEEPRQKHQGPKIIFRHPQWTEDAPWQDIPIMIFTPAQWELIERQALNVSAAPIGPIKLDQNDRYVFALPPRWVGFTDALGQEEAQVIAGTLKALPITR